MPLIKGSSYQKPRYLINQHLETILPSMTRQVEAMPKKVRKRIETPDNDFLDLDECTQGSNKAVIISHGLEGDSNRPYVLGMAKRFYEMGWDVFAWNYRSCGGEMNYQPIMYHSGATYDLETVVQYVYNKSYSLLSLIGFSLGANMTLKYLGEYETKGIIDNAVAISAPLDLAGCSKEIDAPKNRFYAKRFLDSLTDKIKQKVRSIPNLLPHLDELTFQSLYHFDDAVTGPLHGFEGADHYYEVNSSMQFINSINIPTLVINAQNDPFLSPSCYSTSNFQSSEHVYLEMPKFGGHVGFSKHGSKQIYWSEERALRFITLQH